MHNITRHTGKITDIQRLQNSLNGNPRFTFVIDGYQVQTTPDSSHAYGIQNHRDKITTVTVGTHYGKLSLNSIEA